MASGGLSPGRLVALVSHLPSEGSVARAEGVWPDETELAAIIAEELDALIRLIHQAFGGKRAPWKPLSIPRPKPIGPPPEPKVRREARDVNELLGALLGGAR